MKPVQYFSDDYLKQCSQATPEAVLEYLESFRLLLNSSEKSNLTSIEIPEPLLTSFRRKCELEKLLYQTQIKVLMEEWLRAESDESSETEIRKIADSTSAKAP